MIPKTSEPASQRPVSPSTPSEPPKKPTIRTGVVAFSEQEKEELGQHPKTKKRSLSSKQGISRTKSKSEHTIDDEGEEINSTAVIGDAVVDLVTGDDEDESTTFVLCLAAAGVIFSIISYVYNKDNSDVLTGIYIFMAGYAVLLLRILPFWLTTVGIGGLLASVFASGNTTLLLWLSLASLGTGLLGYLIRYLIPQSIIPQKTILDTHVCGTLPHVHLRSGYHRYTLYDCICPVVHPVRLTPRYLQGDGQGS